MSKKDPTKVSPADGGASTDAKSQRGALAKLAKIKIQGNKEVPIVLRCCCWRCCCCPIAETGTLTRKVCPAETPAGTTTCMVCPVGDLIVNVCPGLTPGGTTTSMSALMSVSPSLESEDVED